MSIELLRCPYCGGEPVSRGEGVVMCNNTKELCQNRASVFTIAAWNRRFVRLDKNEDKVFAGDKVRTAFRGTISLEPVMTVMFGGKPNRRLCSSGEIELIKEDNE